MKTVIFLLVFVSLACAADIKLAWTPNTESNLAGYKVYRNYTSSYPFKLAAVFGKNTTYTFKNSTTGRRYYYAVTAYNTTGDESGYSNLVRIYLMTAPTAVHATVITGPLIVQ